ncbi:MAG: hypothetical protein IPN83_10030 [Holophagales bacterium]|nr:hypothetical protein [Holophagales bacterium]
MRPNLSRSDPFDAFPDVVATLAFGLSPVAPPARLKDRLDSRLGEFLRERRASFNLLSRPADRLCTRLLSGPGSRRRTKGSPLARVVVSACGREAAFFCWYLPPRERYTLVFERADGTLVACARLDTDGSGEGELPFLTLPPGPPLASVALRRAASDQPVLAARL